MRNHNTPKPFSERVPELQRIEGWYDTGTYQFKLSCRFKDILRCSEFPPGKPTHFISCFRKHDGHGVEPLLRCYDPTWAIIYTPDKHGNFLGRAFVQLVDGQLHVGRVYGNHLISDDILKCMMDRKLNCQVNVPDTYLGRCV